MMSSAAAAPAPVSYAKIAKGDGEAETPQSAGSVNTTGVDVGQGIKKAFPSEGFCGFLVLSALDLCSVSSKRP